MQETILILATAVAHAAIADRAQGHATSRVDARIADVIKCGMNNMPCPFELQIYDHWTNLHAAAQQVARGS